MHTMTTLKERFLRILQKEDVLTKREIEELQTKQYDNMVCYGIGGFYNRYEKAIKKRQLHQDEIDSLRRAVRNAPVLEPLRLYGYYCPSCSEKIYLSTRNPENVNCPLCDRRLYLDGRYTSWETVRGSMETHLH